MVRQPILDTILCNLVNISFLSLTRVFFMCTNFGSTSAATYGFEKCTHAESLTSPTFNSGRSRISTSPHQKTRSIRQTRKINLAFLHQRHIQKYSTYQHQWQTSDSTPTEYLFKIIKVCPNNITVNQVSIAYTKKKKPVCSQNKLTNSSFWKKLFTKFSEASFFFFF